MMNDGCTPASTSTRASIDDVVVFPWVPPTATPRLVATTAERISARLSTGMVRSRAATISGFVGGIAVEAATTSTSPTFAAS